MSSVYLKWSEWRDEVTEVMLEWGRWEDCWKDFDSCPELEGSREWHGEGNGNPLQCSCLENPRDDGAWWAAVYRVAQSWTRLKWLSNSSSRSKVTRAPFYIPTSSSWGFQFLHIFTNTCCYCHPSGCRVVSHCGFNLQIPKANNLIISSWSS